MSEFNSDETRLIEELYLALQIVLLIFILNGAFPFLSGRTNPTLAPFALALAAYLALKLTARLKPPSQKARGALSILLALTDGLFFAVFILLQSPQWPALHELFYGYVIIQTIRFPAFRLNPFAVYAGVLHYLLANFTPDRSDLAEWPVSLFLYIAVSGIVAFVLRQVKVLQDEREYYCEALQQKNAELEAMASTDYLTKLRNHQAFHTCFDQARRRSHQERRPVSLALIDVDDFKHINDTYGHLVGDHVLHELAVVLKTNTRQSDLVARYGGEEFAILFPDTPLHIAAVLGERIRSAVESHPIETADGPLSITVSIGVVCQCFTDTGASGHECLNRADQLLYEAKSLGKNQVRHDEFAGLIA